MIKKSRILTSFAFMSAAMLASTALLAVDTTPVSSHKEERDATAVNISTMKSASRSNQKSKHSIAFNDTRITVNQQFHKTSTSTASANVGIRNVHFGYKKVNPKGHLYLAVGAQGAIVTEDNWTWKGLAQIEVPTKGWSLTNDSRYIGAIEGSYALNKDVNVHLGIYGQTGMRATNVQPIIGASYTWQDWVFHAVYPSPRVIYNGIKNCQISLNAENIFTAVRSHRVGRFKNGVAVFKGTGTELRLDYTFSNKVKGWVSVGRVLGGKVILGDDYYHKKDTKRVNGPGYAQIGVSYLI